MFSGDVLIVRFALSDSYIYGIAAPITGVEGQSASFAFTISSSDTTVILIKHPSTGNNLLGISGSGAVVVGDNRVTTYVRTTRSQVVFTLNGLTRTDAGVYKATINTVEIGNQELKIIGKPNKPTIVDTETPIVGQDHTIRCIAISTSTAGISGLVMSYQWYRNDGALSTGGRYIISNNKLTIYSVVRTDDNDSFTCEAWENILAKSEKSNQHNIPDPDYPPDGPPVIQGYINGSVYYARENVNVTLICIRDGGKPKASLTWHCLGGNVGVIAVSGNNISRSVTWSVTVSQNGERCICQSKHRTETSPQTVFLTVNVLYPPTITAIADRSIIRGNTLTVTCVASGNPAPTYKWTKSGEVNFSQSGQNLIRSNIQHGNDGTYICRAENSMRPTGSFTSIPGSDTEAFAIYILYPPTITAIHDRVVISGNTLAVVCQASGNPAPAYTWTKVEDGGFSQSGQILLLSKIQRDNAGTYTCYAENNMIPTGSSVGTAGSDTEDLRIDVINPMKPERPSNLSIVTTTTTAVALRWISRFNGGEDQMFVIQYKPTTVWNWTEHLVAVADPGPNVTVYYVLDGIDLLDDYTIRVYSYNAFGRSNVSEEIIVTANLPAPTQEYFGEGNETNFKSATTALGVTCAVLAILFVCTIVFILRKKQLFVKGTKRHSEKTQKVLAESISPVYDEVQNSSENKKDKNVVSKEMTYETQCVPVIQVVESQYDQLQSGSSYSEKGNVYQNTSI